MGNTVISRVTSQKCLGVNTDQKLTWEEHTEKIFKKASARIGAIRRLKPHNNNNFITAFPFVYMVLLKSK